MKDCYHLSHMLKGVGHLAGWHGTRCHKSWLEPGATHDERKKKIYHSYYLAVG